MAKKKTDTEPSEGLLVNAAKIIGKAVGKVATVAGANPEAAEGNQPRRAASVKQAKLPKKNKQRLPRRQKKAQKKAHAGKPAPQTA